MIGDKTTAKKNFDILAFQYEFYLVLFTYPQIVIEAVIKQTENTGYSGILSQLRKKVKLYLIQHMIWEFAYTTEITYNNHYLSK